MFCRFQIVLVLVLALPAFARPLWKLRHSQSAVGSRNRVHANRLITEAGTVEIESASTVMNSERSGAPLLIKYTPRTRIEYSTLVDVADSQSDIAVSANALLYDGERWNVSVSPTVSFLRRSGAGLRFGSTVITRYDHGRFNCGATGTWSQASHPNEDNPLIVASLGGGVGFRLSEHGRWRRWTLVGNIMHEQASGGASAKSISQGVEVELTSRFSVNAFIQQLDVGPGNRPKQLFVSVTMNLGRFR